ncbi:hypothetical protein ACFRMQ_21670 [Kitasatospora sp. NPDC056783]|uniref:hypothetical protein n=1 Tax=Kitasatospora sp. NPDC056783 TaxID=3345943 RepID=UPI0036C0AB1F
MEPVEWLRADYQGRESELIHLAEGAALVGVTRAAVSNWRSRHPKDFPELVLLTGPAARRTKYVVRSEFLEFAKVQLTTEQDDTRRAARPHRPRVVIRAGQVAHWQTQIGRLTDLEKRQAAQLKRTREALRKAKADLARASASLAAEVEAVQKLTLTA